MNDFLSKTKDQLGKNDKYNRYFSCEAEKCKKNVKQTNLFKRMKNRRSKSISPVTTELGLFMAFPHKISCQQKLYRSTTNKLKVLSVSGSGQQMSQKIPGCCCLRITPAKQLLTQSISSLGRLVSRQKGYVYVTFLSTVWDCLDYICVISQLNRTNFKKY